MIFGSGELKGKFLTPRKGRDLDLAIYAHATKIFYQINIITSKM